MLTLTPIRSALRSFCSSAASVLSPPRSLRVAFPNSCEIQICSHFVCSEFLCRYDRPDDVGDAEAVSSGYCNIQLESVEGMYASFFEINQRRSSIETVVNGADECVSCVSRGCE